MRCKLCDYSDTNRTKSVRMLRGEPLCFECRKIITTMSPSKYTRDIVGVEVQAIEELLLRIPELMDGPECPGDCKCNCTKVCKLLADRK